MKFLVDAQLPRRFVGWLAEAGHDVLHTLDLPLGTCTPDSEVIAYAAREGRVVVSKDDDFVQSFLLTGEPQLLLISTGNIANADLEKLLRTNLSGIEAAFAAHRFVEITRDALVIHE
jgi:predicted nuclease of predicted toxin-antitoxin system